MEQVMQLLLEQDDVSWKQVLLDLVKSEQMDPWDINITLLTRKYIELIKQMQENNLRISGKILLAAAFLLKMKSDYLVEHDIAALDLMMNPIDESEDGIYGLNEHQPREKQDFRLIPRNPQPRNRKVSLTDLIDALQRAMATKKRILQKQMPTKFVLPERKVDIMDVIREMYHKITYYSKKQENGEITFTQLLPPRASKQEKVYTFLPILHLENLQKVETRQEKPFEEIFVKLMSKGDAKVAAKAEPES